MIFDIFLVEAIINGILFGGVLALLALGLNLVFGVVDVVWICYAELAMVGMYSIYWGNNHFGIPLVICVVIAILAVALLGFLIHFLVIRHSRFTSNQSASCDGRTALFHAELRDPAFYR